MSGKFARMNFAMIGKWGALCLWLVLSQTIFVGNEPPRLNIELQDKRPAIRAELLKYTPLGSTSGDVLKFIKTRLMKYDSPEPRLENHGAVGPSVESSKKAGVKSIALNLGDYLADPILLTLSTPLPLQMSLTVQWAFDKEDKLIEVFLDRSLKGNE